MYLYSNYSHLFSYSRNASQFYRELLKIYHLLNSQHWYLIHSYLIRQSFCESGIVNFTWNVTCNYAVSASHILISSPSMIYKYLGSTDPCHGGSTVEIVFESEEAPGFMLKTPGDGDLSTFSVEPTPPMVQITPASPGLSIPSLNIIPSTPTRSRSPAPDSITGNLK